MTFPGCHPVQVATGSNDPRILEIFVAENTAMNHKNTVNTRVSTRRILRFMKNNYTSSKDYREKYEKNEEKSLPDMKKSIIV